MKKPIGWVIISVAVFVVLLVGVEFGVWYFRKEDIRVCGGVAALSCPEGYECRYAEDPEEAPDQSGVCVEKIKEDVPAGGDDPVEYSAEVFGETCPLEVKFLVSRETEPVGCRCPEGYELSNTIIGGEECYDGAECIIAAAQCEAIES